MSKPPPDCKIFISLFSVLLLNSFALVISACSEDPVNVSAVNASVVFDWQDNETLPSQRLSVFVETVSNVRRVESLLVKNTDYSWNIESPLMVRDGQRQWAGYMHLEPPPAGDDGLGKFPQGLYSLECIDAAGHKSGQTFTVHYNYDLLKTYAVQAEEKISEMNKKIAVYSEQDELLFFDKPSDRWLDDAAVFKNVRHSFYMRKAYIGGGVICLLPKIYKEGANPDGIDSNG